MTRHLHAIAALLTVTVVATACGNAEEDRLVAALDARGEAGPTALYAPEVDGELPSSWSLHPDGSVTLSWARDGSGFDGTLTLREGQPGDICAGRAPEWDMCDRRGIDVALLAFEEQNAIAVRMGIGDGSEADELLFSDFSLELPDESYGSEDERRQARMEPVLRIESGGLLADELTAEEFVEVVPAGTIKD